MKSNYLKLIFNKLTGGVFISMIFFCCHSVGSEKINENTADNNSFDHGCLAAYEISSVGDTINKSFADGKKHGHWIHYEFIHESMKKKNNSDPNERSRIGKYIHQKGTYIYGKKTGVWKTYDKNGTLTDSFLVE